MTEVQGLRSLTKYNHTSLQHSGIQTVALGYRNISSEL